MALMSQNNGSTSLLRHLLTLFSLTCIQLLIQKTTMSNFEKPKKLKSAYSLQTNCTLDQLSDAGFRINILSPKPKKDQAKQASTSIKELDFQEENGSPSNSFSRKLMQIPMLCKKQSEISFLEASNNSEPLQSQRLRSSNKSILKSEDIFEESIDLREMNLTHGSKSQASDRQLSNSDGITNKINHQTTTKIDEHLLKKSKEESTKNAKYHTPQQHSQKIIDSIPVTYQQSVKQDPQNISSPEKKSTNINHYKTANIKLQIPNLKILPKNLPLQSIKSERQITNKKSSSKMKLRDYLYMVDATRKQSKSRQKEEMKVIKVESPLLSKKIVTDAKINSQKKQEKVESNHTDMHNRKEAIKAKYSVSNGAMFDILKEDIFAQIDHAEQMLRTVKEGMRELHHPTKDDPSPEQLLMLYNLRRQMKEEVNKKLQNALQIFNNERKKCQATKVEQQKAEEISYADLIKLSRSRK